MYDRMKESLKQCAKGKGHLCADKNLPDCQVAGQLSLPFQKQMNYNGLNIFVK